MILVKKNLNKSLVFCANERLAQKTSNSLIYHEQPDRITHSRSVVMSDLSDLLTVVHLSWANRSQSLIWSERSERMSDKQIKKIQNSPDFEFWVYFTWRGRHLLWTLYCYTLFLHCAICLENAFILFCVIYKGAVRIKVAMPISDCTLRKQHEVGIRIQFNGIRNRLGKTGKSIV